jgi:hypothetical protein
VKEAYILPTLAPTLTNAQRVALVRIIEEAAEVQKCATKILRFGFVATDHNVSPPKTYDNNGDLMRELTDLMEANIALQKVVP